MCNFSLHKLITSFLVRTISLNDSIFKWYWRTITLSYLSTNRILTLLSFIILMWLQHKWNAMSHYWDQAWHLLVWIFGFFGDLTTDTDSSGTEGEVIITGKFEHFYQFCGTCVGYSENKNVTDPQKELLIWHWKLGISMYRIQEFMKEQKIDEPNGNKFVVPPFICPKMKSSPKWPVPTCTSCLLACSKKRLIETKKQTIVPEKEVILSHKKYKPVNLVSIYQFVVTTPGWLQNGYGRDSSSYHFHEGTLCNYSDTGIIWIENQVSLGYSERILGK